MDTHNPANRPTPGSSPHRTPSRVVAPSAPANSIRLDATKLDRLLDAHDAGSANNAAALKRSHVRHTFRTLAVKLTLSHPGGSQTRFSVACRNLSSGGIGVLHSAYVHSGTPCTIELVSTSNTTHTIEGKVVRCGHLQGTVHEIGIKFNGAIDTREFLALDPFADRFTLESVDPQNLTGTVLYIEDVALDQAVVRHFLRETQMQLVVVTTADEALAKAAGGVDIILCNHEVGGVPGAVIINKMREAGISQPILIVTADTSPATREMLGAANCDAFITKPLKQSTLFRALGEFCTGNSGGGLFSSLPENHPNVGLIETFIREVREYAKQIDAATQAGDAARVRTLCIQIRGSAPILGFERLADMAAAVEAILARSGSVSDAAVAIKTLTNACNRTSARAAA
ncbi:MAG: response regulator [Phycisphaerales bacterium]|nr:response regulator [Phycisphaerales bacterium]